MDWRRADKYAKGVVESVGGEFVECVRETRRERAKEESNLGEEAGE
jgi:hypothetical protein